MAACCGDRHQVAHSEAESFSIGLLHALAYELIATGDRISAARAAELGFLNKLAPKGEAVAEAIAFAERINQNAPIAVRESLRIARRAYDLSDDALFALGLEAQDRLMTTEDFAEGPRAFVEKRAPQWKAR
jgi:enoyl-CoA hydratase/carnithine racemase